MRTKIRFSTLLRDHGPLRVATRIPHDEWMAALAERRFMTVYHSEKNWCEPVAGLVAHHGFCDTICKVVFAKPLPPEVTEVIGMRDSQEAWDLCNHEI